MCFLHWRKESSHYLIKCGVAVSYRPLLAVAGSVKGRDAEVRGNSAGSTKDRHGAVVQLLPVIRPILLTFCLHLSKLHNATNKLLHSRRT